MKGDVVKRSLTDVESAVVMDLESRVRLRHAVAKHRTGGWIPFAQVKNALSMEARDRVFYDQWVGTVEEASFCR
jgi:ubiquitin-conjugating enzyme E2 O